MLLLFLVLFYKSSLGRLSYAHSVIFRDYVMNWEPVFFKYSRLPLNGHLYKTDTSVKRTPRVGPCLSLLPLFDSPQEGHVSKTDA